MKTLTRQDLYHAIKEKYLNRVFKVVRGYGRNKKVDLDMSELEKNLQENELNQVGAE